MANTLLTIDMITNSALEVLENNLVLTKQINREYDDQFAKTGAKIGDTLNIRKPVRYVTRSGPALQVQNSTESYVPVTLTQKGCDISFDTKNMTLSIDEFQDRFVKPQVASVANTIDYDVAGLYDDVYWSVGTPGTTPNALRTYLLAGVKLDNAAAPRDDMRAAVLDPIAQAELVDGLKGLFNDTSEIAKQYRDGTMGRTAGLKFSMDQNVRVHTSGSITGSVTVATSSVTGATTLALTGLTASTDTVATGDVFTVAGVYSVNPQSRQTTNQLMQVTVVTGGTADSSGNLTVTFSPALVYNPGSQQDQNVNSLPASGAAVTFFAGNGAAQNSTQNLVFHRDAFTLATADLFMPQGVDMAARKRGKKLNISMRAIRAYDINNDRLPMRIDVLYGAATMRPELACRVWG